MSDLCDDAFSSDEWSDYEYEEEDNNACFEGHNEYSRLARKVIDIYITRCNNDNWRKPHSGFDITYRRCLGHFFARIDTCKRKYGNFIFECFNNNIYWSKISLIVEDVVIDFSTLKL